MNISKLFIVLFLISTVFLVRGQGQLVMATEPEDHGFSSEQLDLLSQRLEHLLDQCGTPGANAMIIKDGHVIYDKSFGYQDKLRQLKMSNDAIFRIYSMTKPLTSVAAMILWEQGYIKLNEPIFLYLPEFRNVQVAYENDAGNVMTRDAIRPITIQDLLRHTSGITYGSGRSQSEIREPWRQVRLGEMANSDSFCKHIAQIPLVADPGSHWDYGYSTDVLGRLIEVVSGQSLDEFIKEKITIPLEMHDTDFFVPQDKVPRLAQGFDTTTYYYPTNLWDPSRRRSMASGGGGMVSTIRDYGIFCQMLLNHGTYNKKRILSPKTVKFMTSNHLPSDLINQDEYYLPQAGYGFGLGFAVRQETGIAFSAGSKGDYRWGGAAGTGFWVDPQERLICILMVQHMGSSYFLRDRFKALVYQAMN